MKAKKWLYATVGLVAMGAALTYALWMIDLGQLFDVLRRVHYPVVFPFIVTPVAFSWLKATRWTVLLRSLGTFKARQVAPAMIIGFGANNVLPARVGEIVRTIVFCRASKITMSGVFVSIVVERMFDFLAILVLYSIAVTMVDGAPEILRVSAQVIGAVLILMFAFVFAMLHRPALVHHLWDAASAHLPESWGAHGKSAVEGALTALETLGSAGQLTRIVLNSLVQWTLMGVCVWLSLWAFGVSLSPAVAAIVLAVTAAALSLPSTPGHFGPTQAAFVFSLQGFTVAPEEAFAASLFFLVAQWIPVTLTAGFLLVRAGYSFSELKKTANDNGLAPK